jgi:hypothetical protein
LFPEPQRRAIAARDATAGSPGVTGHRNGATSTTSFTGPAAVGQASRTASSCAASTTPWSTRSDGTSLERPATSRSTTTSAMHVKRRTRRAGCRLGSSALAATRTSEPDG